jgi:esterase/lipase superfamily enzyme
MSTTDTDDDQRSDFDDLLDKAQEELGVTVGDDKPLDAEREEPVDPLQDNAAYTVWYGTNRQPILKDGELVGFSAQRDPVVHFGQCTVFIPKGHKTGSTGSSWWIRFWTGVDDRLKLIRLTGNNSNNFWRSFRKSLGGGDGERTAVVFIHGYNVSFETAALTAAQLGFDLSIRAGMAFFSWPSQGTLAGYLADGTAIDASEGDIEDFLIGFIEKSGASTVHIIAHSMGNRGLLRAVNAIVNKVRLRAPARFGQVILAAADVDANVFRSQCSAYREFCRRTTLYVSARDLAVGFSGRINRYARVGRMPPIFVAEHIDTIHVSRLETDFIGHGYVAAARPVINDIFLLLRHGLSPSERQLHKKVTAEGFVYWELPA